MAQSAEGVAAFLEQVRSVPSAQHDPLTLTIMDAVGVHLEALSQGADVHPDLAEWIRRIKLCPLSESQGEGYHRSTAVERKRAPASAVCHVKRTVRFKRSRRAIANLQKSPWDARPGGAPLRVAPLQA